MFHILCFQSVCQSAWPRYKIQQGHCFFAPTAHTSCWSNHQLKPCHTTTSYGFQAVSTFTNPVLYHPWLCSNLLNPTLHFFLQSGHLNMYMHHHHSLALAEPLLYGKFESPIINHNSNFITSKGASQIQWSSFHMESILQKYWYSSSWGIYALIPDALGLVHSSMLTGTVISYFALRTSLSPLSYKNGFHRTKNM
jgi:hypothetical protein